MVRRFHFGVALVLGLVSTSSRGAAADEARAADAPVEPAPPAARDESRVADVPELPEPMMFDLVRGLDARRGEFEINTLVAVPISRDGGRVVWAPEAEWAILDGVALEVEFPMENLHLRALKFAAQATFGALVPHRLAHGTQLIAEHLVVGSRPTELTALYLLGADLGGHFGLFSMTGMRNTFDSNGTEAGVEPRSGGVEALHNANVFYTPSDRLAFGFEANLAWRINADFEAMLMPQIHVLPFHGFRIQFGFGVAYDAGEVVPTAATRLIAEF
jgi:hypothetical protein